MNLRFIKSSEKARLLEQLREQFGIEELQFLLIETGKEKVRGYTGHLSKDELAQLGQLINIEIIGIYLLKQERELRLSFDATQLLSEQINLRVVDLTEEQTKQWMKGQDIALKALPGIYVVRFQRDCLGCGRSNGETLFNYVPKDRRVKK
jgi:NOL1/NOP2/fmu family ribosome biogenesis protein